MIRAVRRFSLRKQIFDMFQYEDTGSNTHQLLTQSPLIKSTGVTELSFQPGAGDVSVKELSNGIKVVSERTRQPGLVYLGLLLNVGTRDQSDYTSGALLSIKNTYYKTVLNTNETVNYGMVQMSGGKYEMNYGREHSIFKAHCLPHDVVDIFSMVSDCALEPRSVVAAQAALKKNEHSHKLDAQLGGNHQFTDNLFKVAFDNQGLGRPILGNKGNVQNLSTFTLQKFQLQNINASKVTVVGVGVDSHDEFFELAQEKLGYILNTTATPRQKSKYAGGQLRTLTESSVATLAFAFQGAESYSPDAFALAVAAEILGNSSERSGRLSELVGVSSTVDSADSFNYAFSDSGLFGLKVTGSAAHLNQILHSVQKVVKEPISENEVSKAKQRLVKKILGKLDRPYDRLEVLGRNVASKGETECEFVAKGIRQVSASQVQSALKQSLSTKLSLNAKGGLVTRLPSFDSISSLFKP